MNTCWWLKLVMELQQYGTQGFAKVFAETRNPVQIAVHANQLNDTCTIELRLRSVLSDVKINCSLMARHSFTTNNKTFRFCFLFAWF
jgi:hypothetical protein